MTKKNKIVIAVLSLLLVVGIVAVIFTSGGAKTVKGNKIEDSISGTIKTDYPLVQTDVDNIFYEPNPDGTIKFYRINDQEIYGYTDSEVKTASAKIEISYQTVPIKIYYINTDNGVVGYGLFTAEQDSNVKLLSYVLVKLIATPEAYKSEAGTKYMLLADADAEDAYKINKTYSEIYSFNIDSGKTERLISQRDRTVQEDGTVNEGWTIFTDSSMNCLEKNDLFASTRTHDSRAEEKLYSIMNIANSSSMKKATAAKIQDSPSCEIREKDGDWYCFASTDTGFDIVKNGDKKNPIKSFEGSFSDYDVTGDWILNKTTCEVTNIYTGETKSLESVDLTGFSEFIVNADGTKLAIVLNSEKTQSIICCDMQNGTQLVINNDSYDSGIGNTCFVDASHILLSNYDSEKLADNMIFEF